MLEVNNNKRFKKWDQLLKKRLMIWFSKHLNKNNTIQKKLKNGAMTHQSWSSNYYKKSTKILSLQQIWSSYKKETVDSTCQQVAFGILRMMETSVKNTHSKITTLSSMCSVSLDNEHAANSGREEYR